VKNGSQKRDVPPQEAFNVYGVAGIAAALASSHSGFGQCSPDLGRRGGIGAPSIP
jgi:hypothetical protein